MGSGLTLSLTYGPSSDFPFSKSVWNQPVPKSACNAVAEFLSACLFHAPADPRLPFLQPVRFPVHGYDIPLEPGPANRQCK